MGKRKVKIDEDYLYTVGRQTLAHIHRVVFWEVWVSVTRYGNFVVVFQGQKRVHRLGVLRSVRVLA